MIANDALPGVSKIEGSIREEFSEENNSITYRIKSFISFKFNELNRGLFSANSLESKVTPNPNDDRIRTMKISGIVFIALSFLAFIIQKTKR